jgi:hypothetical protein
MIYEAVSESDNGIWAKKSINISHDHADFEAQIPFSGSDGLFHLFDPKIHFSCSI